MKKILIGVLACLVTELVLGYLAVISGILPVATRSPALPLEEFLAKSALHAALKSQRDAKPPAPLAAEDVVAGAKIYAAQCAVCHGIPGREKSAIADGMFPPPPQLFAADEMVTDDPIGTVFWKVKNGIRLTGMPGFDPALSEVQMWQVSQLLITADRLSPQAQAALSGR